MTQYQATPDYYRDYIEHGWLKDTASKVHKYIERWRGKNGKWYYRYKSKALESATKFANKAVGINDPRSVVNNEKPSAHWFPLLGSSRGRNVVGTDNGKANSRRGQAGSRLKAGLTAGRKRATKKAIKKGTGYSGSSSPKRTLTSRGYSGSRGSNSNNKATSNKLKNGLYYRDKTGYRSTVSTPRNYGNLSNRGYSDSTGFDSKRENNWFVTDTRKPKVGHGPEQYKLFDIKKDKNGWTTFKRKKKKK